MKYTFLCCSLALTSFAGIPSCKASDLTQDVSFPSTSHPSITLSPILFEQSHNDVPLDESEWIQDIFAGMPLFDLVPDNNCGGFNNEDTKAPFYNPLAVDCDTQESSFPGFEDVCLAGPLASDAFIKEALRQNQVNFAPDGMIMANEEKHHPTSNCCGMKISKEDQASFWPEDTALLFQSACTTEDEEMDIERAGPQFNNARTSKGEKEISELLQTLNQTGQKYERGALLTMLGPRINPVDQDMRRNYSTSHFGSHYSCLYSPEKILGRPYETSHQTGMSFTSNGTPIVSYQDVSPINYLHGDAHINHPSNGYHLGVRFSYNA
jgi:hypothetical protein